MVRAQATRKQVEASPRTLALSSSQLGLNGGAAMQFSDSFCFQSSFLKYNNYTDCGLHTSPQPHCRGHFLFM